MNSGVGASMVVKSRSRLFKLENEVLWKHVGVGDLTGGRWIQVPRLSEREAILKKQVHDGHGHFRCQSTWARLYLNYWWTNAYQEVKDYVKSCYLCQLSSRIPKRDAPNSIDVAHIFQRWGLIIWALLRRVKMETNILSWQWNITVKDGTIAIRIDRSKNDNDFIKRTEYERVFILLQKCK